MTSPPIAYAARLAYQNKRAQEEHWDLTSEQHCFARAMTADMLGLLRTVAAHGGIKISKQGGMVGTLVAHDFVTLDPNSARSARAAITIDGLRALAMRATTLSAAGVALKKR